MAEPFAAKLHFADKRVIDCILPPGAMCVRLAIQQHPTAEERFLMANSKRQIVPRWRSHHFHRDGDTTDFREVKDTH